MTHAKTQYTVIYNKLNHEAVLAAAILMTHLEDARSCDISQLIDDQSEQYIWIGVEPIPGYGSFHETVGHKTHIVIINDNPGVNAVTKVKKSFMLLGNYMREEKHMTEELTCDLGLKRTLIHRVCEYFDIQDGMYEGLAFHAAKFHDKKAELQYLVFVYKNVMHAEQCLITGDKYQVVFQDEKDIATYLEAVEQTKKYFKKGYQEIKVQDGDVTRMALYTTISDSSYHLALRLIKLSHRNFINLSMGLSGTIAYSNMRKIKFDQSLDHPIVMN